MSKSDEEWRRLLTAEQYRVLRQAGTERPFTGVYDDCHDEGTYRCAACDAPLFASDTKFESGSGWPSFFAPAEGAVVRRRDIGLLGLRTEVRCLACGSHLGHVFRDGPRPTGQRYCINSCALKLEPRERPEPPGSSSSSSSGGSSSSSSSSSSEVSLADPPIPPSSDQGDAGPPG